MKNFKLMGIVATLLMGSSVPAYAIKAFPGTIAMQQPDGTCVNVRIVGDENFHYYVSEDGFALSRNDRDELVYYILDENGAPVVSDIRFTTSTAEMVQSQLKLDKDAINTALNNVTFQSSVKFRAPGPGLYTDTPYPSTGSPKALVLLVAYKDVAFTLEDPNDYFNRMLNQEGFADDDATGSVFDWFNSNSCGQFTPQFDVYGPVVLPKNMMWYGANQNQGFDAHPEEMVLHGLELIDDEVDLSQYDCNGDGMIDNVFVFYAGYGENEGGSTKSVWPHSSDITQLRPEEKFVFDGVIANHYACASEQSLYFGHPCGIGLFIHEFSHVLGLPDLYATANTVGIYSPGKYSPLDAGPYNNEYRTPPNYSMFERYALGWVEPKSLTQSGEVVLPPIKSNEGIIITTQNPYEYYLLENRQLEGNDEYIPYHGMLVWHIDYDRARWERNTVNNDPDHQLVDLIEADCMANSYTPEGDPFPGEDNVTSLTPETRPALLDWQSRPLGISLTNIREDEAGNVCFYAEVDNSSAIDVVVDNAAYSIAGNVITAKADLRILNIQGIEVQQLGTGMSAQLPAGLYLINANNSTEKISIINQ